MIKFQVFGKYLAVIAILSVLLCGPAGTSVANVPEGETERHDTSVKGDNADPHPVGDLMFAQGQQLIGDDIGILRGAGKGRGQKGEKPYIIDNKVGGVHKGRGGTTAAPVIIDNKVKVHGAQGIGKGKSSPTWPKKGGGGAPIGVGHDGEHSKK